MLIQEIIGKLNSIECNNRVIDHLNLEWYETKKRVLRKSTEKGEELSFFYPATEWEMQAPFICLCGAASCIHVVAGARFLSLSTLENHYLSKHIREQMVELLNGTKSHLKKLQEG